MLKEIVNKVKSALDNTEEINEIDEKYFAEVMKEIKSGYKEEGLEGKSIAMSGGDTNKANSIYVQLRAEYLQNKEEQDNIRVIRKEIKHKQEQERLDLNREETKKERKNDNDELYYALRKCSEADLIKLYQKEIEYLGYHKASFFSFYPFEKNGKKYDCSRQPKKKKLIIYEPNHYSSPETIFNLEDKADEIIARFK